MTNFYPFCDISPPLVPRQVLNSQPSLRHWHHRHIAPDWAWVLLFFFFFYYFALCWHCPNYQALLKHLPTHHWEQEPGFNLSSTAIAPVLLSILSRTGRQKGSEGCWALSSFILERLLKATEFIFRWPQKCPMSEKEPFDPQNARELSSLNMENSTDFLCKGLFCALLSIPCGFHRWLFLRKSAVSFLPCVGLDSTAFDRQEHHSL